jgi:GNAT superfamily N-acetyltransferase
VTERCYREASAADIDALVALINSVYRGDSSRLGWTTEADLLDGQRTDAHEIAELMAAPDSFFLVADDERGLLGCVHLTRDGDRAWFGMFSVRPGRQGQGLGRALLREAEQRVRGRWAVAAMRMSVISARCELIGYYQRRGYRLTGETQPFPTDPRFGIPKVAHLEFVVLEKRLPPPAEARRPTR